MKLGIVGLPNVGKSTLFNSLTKAGAESANYPFCTIDPNVGIVTVPDARVDYLAEKYHSKKVIPAAIEFVDIAGLVKGASKGEGLGNQFLANIREVDDEEDQEILNSCNLLTIKPVIFAANVNEDELAGEDNDYVKAVREYAADVDAKVFVVCAQIEQEISELDDDEKKEFLEDLGLEESGLEKLISASYSLLGLISFLTSGEDETRAWTIKEGTKAPQAAGKIHTDFERGFICAEVVSFEDLKEYGTMQACKEKGLVRQEGKEYVVKDGDIIVFRFNV